MIRWSVEQVEAIAPSAAAVSAARPLATPARWRSLGADDRTLWGSCQGSGAEPYDTVVDHVGVGFSCTCPSRRSPCKHAIALLLLWAGEQVPDASPPSPVRTWADRRTARDRPVDAGTIEAATAGVDGSEHAGSRDAGTGGPEADPELAEAADPADRDRSRDERVERMYAGLAELDRWLDDRIRTGLADPALARYSTWDSLAARLVDAQAGSLANRIRRLAGLVGASPDWHDDVLAELGILHLLSQAGRRLGSLPGPLADAVATSVGWQVRRADVLAGVPDTDHWIVAGRSDTREDRIEVRRHWLRGARTGRWALVLSFAAYRQSLDTSLVVGTTVHADLHRYPGPALRALVGRRHDDPAGASGSVDAPGSWPTATAGETSGAPATIEAATVASGCDQVGTMLAAEPWLDRLPMSVHAALTGTTTTSTTAGDRWALTDHSGSVPLLHDRATAPAVATLLAVSGGAPIDVTVEWTPHGVVPLTVHLADRSIDVGPRADGSFVSAA